MTDQSASFSMEVKGISMNSHVFFRDPYFRKLACVIP